MSKEESIIEMMVDYFLANITNEETIKEMAATILHEDYGIVPEEVDQEATDLVNKLWFDAEYRADMENREAKAMHDAKVHALMGAVAWR